MREKLNYLQPKFIIKVREKDFESNELCLNTVFKMTKYFGSNQSCFNTVFEYYSQFIYRAKAI